MRVRLPVRLERRRPPRGDEREVGDHLVGAGRLRVMHHVGRVGIRREQDVQDLRVQPAAARNRDARPDRVARQLVAEVNVGGVDLEQLAALRLLGRGGPVGHHGVEQWYAHAVRHHRNELDEAAAARVEAGRAAEHGVRDGRRRLVGVAAREQLGHVERIASGCCPDRVCAIAGERRDRAHRQRFELDHHRVVGADRAERRIQRMAPGRLAAAEGENEQRGQRGDPPSEDGDHVERRVVGPVDVLEDEHRRLRRLLELRDQQRLDLVRRGPR